VVREIRGLINSKEMSLPMFNFKNYMVGSLIMLKLEATEMHIIG